MPAREEAEPSWPISRNPQSGPLAGFEVIPEGAIISVMDCAECQRLWREYAATTNRLVKCKDRLNDSYDEAVEKLVEGVGIVREVAWQAIKRHLRKHCAN